MDKKPAIHSFLTLDQIGQACGLSTFTVSRYVRDGQLPGVRIGGRVRVSEQAFSDFVEARNVPQPPTKESR